MPLYQTTGTLTGTIESENVAEAQCYLTEDDMTRYLTEDSDTPWAAGVVEHLEWQLDGNGHDYKIVVFALRPLTDEELRQLSSWCSGQNSDGLGENFEQQEFAELLTEDEYYEEHEYAGMISFDWETNKLPWTRVR